MYPEDRREPRYRVTDKSKVSVSLKFAHLQRAGELLDLSRSGVRLRVRDSIPEGAGVRICISATETNLNVELDAKLCWLHADRDGWHVGFAFQPRLDTPSLDALAHCGAIERRGDDRRALFFPAAAKTSLAAEFQDIRIVNVSAGGFGAVSQGHLGQPNDRLLLRIEARRGGDDQLIQARIAWVKETTDSRHSLGCSFLTKSDFKKLQAVAEADRVGNPLFRMRRTMSATRWSVVATYVMMLVVVLQQIFIVQRLLR